MLSCAGPGFKVALSASFCEIRRLVTGPLTHAQHTNHCAGQIQINVAGLFV